MNKKLFLIISLAGVVLFAAGSASAASYNISVTDNYFNPANLQISPGDTITWINNGQNPHTITSDAGAELNSGTLYTNNFYSHTFYNTGTFNYHCAIHPAMHGTITVGSGAGYLSVSKKVINLTSGNLNWQTSVNANPGDILSFVIALQAIGQGVNNILVRDILPANLIYNGNLTINAGLNYSANPQAGINVGTLPAGQIYVISYQARVATNANFALGTTTLNNSAAITSTEAGTQIAGAQVIVNKSAVSGATYIPSGITNNPIKDSFFFPMALIILGSWLYLSGRIYRFSDWLGMKI